jgi:5,10-methylenetetrahydromethanopterin reductase
VRVIRTLLDDGAITFDGEFFRYNGLFTFARPVQEHLPVKMGAMRGPRSFQAAAEHSDGCHHALGYTAEAYDYMAEHMKIGAERAGKDWTTLDFGAWVAARRGPRLRRRQGRGPQHVGIYASSMPVELLQRNGGRTGRAAADHDAMGAGDLARAVELTTPALVEKLSFRRHTGRDHREDQADRAGRGQPLVAAITDASIVKTFTGREIPGVATVTEQLQLLHDEVMPAFA